MPLPDPTQIRGLLARGQVIVSCRRFEGQTMPPGAKRGYHCALCQTEVQALPRGQALIEAGATILCNTCGTTLAELKADQGKLGGIAVSEEADAAIKQGKSPLSQQLDLLRMAHPFKPEDHD